MHTHTLTQNPALFLRTTKQNRASDLPDSVDKAMHVHSFTTTKIGEEAPNTTSIGKPLSIVLLSLSVDSERCEHLHCMLSFLVCESLKHHLLPQWLHGCQCIKYRCHTHMLPPRPRSTPCPNVKLNDEWGDPTHCDQADTCCYCHTRTEQQFHPEVQYVCICICMCVCMCVCAYVCMYECMYVCVCACVYVCAYVCVYVCILYA